MNQNMNRSKAEQAIDADFAQYRSKHGLTLTGGLDKRVAVYVPSEDKHGKPIAQMDFVNKAAQAMTEIFGGATCQNAFGFWKSTTSGRVVNEKVVIVYSYYASANDESFQKFFDFVERFKFETKQEAISIELHGALYFAK